MNRKMTLTTAAMAVVLGLSIVAANEKAPADYVAAMKGINSTNMQIGQAIAAKDYAAIEAGAATLKGHADVTAKFWAAKKVDDAIKSAADLSKAVADLAAAAKAKDDAGIAAAQTAKGATCRTCHTAHRSEKLADGTYEIK